MSVKSTPFRCDVCGLQFRVTADAIEAERPVACPRCRVPFVRPVIRKGRRADALRQLTLYRGMACG